MSKTKLIIKYAVGLIAVAFMVLIGGFIYFSRTLPTVSQITNNEVVESTKIYDRTGENLIYEIHGEEKRTNLSADQIPDILRQATVAIEDKDFYSHPAIDFKSIIRAGLSVLKTGRLTQGGSTITQQLAKTSFLTPEKSITRKMKEFILAYRIEKIYSKDEVLNLYLNSVPYGYNAYGVEAASQLYFGKHAIELNLSEASMLAAIVQAPSYFSPWGSHLSELEERRVYALMQMEKTGVIDVHQRDYAIKNKPVIQQKPKKANFELAPHFVTYVQEYLNNKYGEDYVNRAGLKVITTLDKNLQEIANKAVKDGGERNTELYDGHNAALIAEDPKTGQVLAMVGSKDYSKNSEPEGCIEGKTCKFEGNFNVVTQGLRQPGSSFKPFVYLTAFTEGFTPESIVFDTPTEFSVGKSDCPQIPDYSNSNPNCYHPQDFDKNFHGPITMKESLAQSVNITAVKTLYMAGFNRVLQLADSFGISTFTDKSRIGLSLVLGGGEVKMSEMAEAYSVLASEGIKREPTTILRIEDKKGDTLEEWSDKPEKVIDPNYPRLINSILSNRDLRAPLYSSNLNLTEVPGYQIAMKTGTTNNYVDAWTFGYTPNLVVGVWAGNNNQSPLQRKGSSILAAIPMWHDFISQAVKLRPNESFTKPEAIETATPILKGELDTNNIHDTLYFLNRTDDPQYENWESGVQYWLKNNNNRVNFVLPSSSYSSDDSQKVSQNDGRIMKVNILTPKSGDFVNNNLSVSAEITSDNPIKKINLYLNDVLIDQGSSNGSNFTYQFQGEVNNLRTQNVIKLTAESNNDSASDQIIVFK